MNVSELQQWLGTHGQSLVIDGQAGPATRAAIIAVFANPAAPAVSDDDIDAIADRLGCSIHQLRAVATVESGGGPFDKLGRPKILFERHWFHKLTNGRFGINFYSDPNPGGYAADSWEKLTMAASRDPDSAFMSASWGKFQIMGLHWQELGYPSPIDMAYSTVTSEAGHYEMLERFIEHEGLNDKLKAISDDPETCRAFAKAYNGPGYARFDYHRKLAKALAL